MEESLSLSPTVAPSSPLLEPPPPPPPSPPPLNCYSGLSNDVFAGWYAVTDESKCNDFCFWMQQPLPPRPEEESKNNTSSDNGSTTIVSVADPHQTTITEMNAKWVCLVNSASDGIHWSDKFQFPNYNDQTSTSTDDDNDDGDDSHYSKKSHSLIKIFHNEQIYKFDYLQCNRGAGEKLYSNGQIVMESTLFWSFVLAFCLAIFMVQIIVIVQRRRKRRRDFFQDTMKQYHDELEMNLNESVLQGEEENDHDDCAGTDKMTRNHTAGTTVTGELSISHHQHVCIYNQIVSTTNNTQQQQQQQQQQQLYQHVKSTTPIHNNDSTCINGISSIKYQSTLVLMTLINMCLLYFLFTATLVITEINGKLSFPPYLQSLTPPCSETEQLCPIANMPLDNPSTHRSEALNNDNVFSPFSYIIASDSQLDWYNGESSSIGLSNYPYPCSSTDSCQSCTLKLGTHTNNQMKKSFEKLIHRDHDGFFSSNNTSNSRNNNRPTPKTLILNGDLTQYFHRSEKNIYESIYHNIDGLEQFFPSLGNHDYDQKSGATFNNDEWIGPHYCNGKHAVSYIKGAFCNKIPKFNARERLTRYDPKSLSYSWEEGPYHFLQLHYYPNFENAGLGISSSITWLERDLQLANEKNLTSVVYVHASSGLPDILEDTFLNNNVAVIFTGHIHRCLGNKCELVRGLNTFQAETYLNATNTGKKGTTDNFTAYDRVEKCFPSSAALCSNRANGNGLFYVKDKHPNLTLPDRKLVSTVPVQRGLCPVPNFGPYLNETDNTSLCHRQSIPAHFPRQTTNIHNKTIPIFWSGSASFETFLLAEFHSDRIIINMMTASEGKEGSRYIDEIIVPNAIYPFHTYVDLDEQVIYV